MALDGLMKLVEDLEKFDAHKELVVILSVNSETIADLQRDQMLEGRGADGEFIRPYYSENPYFKTKESAERYALWKEKITPNPQRPRDVPNLIINGYFHDSLSAKIGDEMFEIETSASFGDDVFRVHKNAQGLNEEKRLLFIENITLPAFGEALLEKTGLVL